MTSAYRLALALLASASLLACSQSPAPSAPTASDDADQGFISRHVDKALAEARKELATGNISISDGITLGTNGRQDQGKDANLPKAEITPQGELLIEGKAVAVTPQQREQLLAYRGQIIGIAEVGMEIGSQGADLAGEALTGVAGAIFGGEDSAKDFEQRMEAQGEKLEAEAQKICVLLPPLLSTQQALAASLPAFKPYANMTQQDIDDCTKESRSGNT